VAAGLWFGRDRGRAKDLAEVRGVIGSEKSGFFADPEVAAVFARNGLRLTVDPAGSRRIAELDLSKYEFAFPSSLPSAEKIQRSRQVNRTYSPFYSPMAVATFAPVIHLLAGQGMVRRAPQGHWLLDMPAYLGAADKGLRWEQLPGNTAYPARRNILITTTHPRDSNSAAMYAAVTSYVLNGQNVVRDQTELAKVQDKVARLFLDQGYLESSTEGPWETYLASGLNAAPMVWVYEAQFVGRQMRGDGSIRGDMALVYPSPTVLSKHTLVPLSERGDKIGRLLSEDPALQRLAARHGFRTASFPQVVAEKQIAVPQTLADVVDPPAFEIQEAMLDTIAARYKQ
jgi:hypothetical protein